MNCCDYECNQGRNCPVRIKTAEGFKQVDTDALLRQENALGAIVRVLLIPTLIFAAGVVGFVYL